MLLIILLGAEGGTLPLFGSVYGTKPPGFLFASRLPKSTSFPCGIAGEPAEMSLPGRAKLDDGAAAGARLCRVNPSSLNGDLADEKWLVIRKTIIVILQ